MEEVREIAVEGSEFAFTPSSISVKSGDKVRVTFTNNGSFPHNFTVDELNVASETVSPGESTSVEFTASESGTFDFYCSVGNHRAQGMEGSLEVQ
jgi:plastocyanin